MAVNEKNVLLRSKETNGDTNIIYPITTFDNVDGLEEAFKQIVQSVNGVTPDDTGNVAIDSGVLCVKITDESSSDITWTVNGAERMFTVPATIVSHTYQEVMNAINNGVHVCVINAGYVLWACSYSSSSVGFQMVDYANGIEAHAKLHSDNSVTGYINPILQNAVQINTWEADD